MLLYITLAFFLCGLTGTIGVVRLRRKNSKALRASEGVFAATSGVFALSAVALYGMLSGQIIFPLW